MAGGDYLMDFFMQELGVPGSQLLLAAEQTLYMVFLSLFWIVLIFMNRLLFLIAFGLMMN